MKIYLDESITLENTSIGLTYEGLRHMVNHYQHLIKIARPEQLAENDKLHMESIIKRYQEHIEIYERSGEHLINDQRGGKKN